MRGSINQQVNRIWYHLDGIGVSKKTQRLQSEFLGQNGHNVSDLVHSYKLKDQTIRVAKELAIFSRKQFNISDMQCITNEHIEIFIADKIEQGLKYRSISTYISIIEKIRIALIKQGIKLPEHKNSFNRDGLVLSREIASRVALRNKHINRAYNNLDLIGSNIDDPLVKFCFDLQVALGLRVAEATLILKEQLLGGNKIVIQGKGGYLLEKELTQHQYKLLKQHLQVNGSLKLDYAYYIKKLKFAVSLSNQTWTGSHGIRYNYAQRKYAEYISLGSTATEALKNTSEDLGHHRIEITSLYLK